ncbi:AfsR/SARP family transcriptional regulator [Phytoactinopolyspora halotolerans]|uniref:AfsR/SARP family transcriptional regulator n=1 Tax=Phytoactinopolyspora halotolerans TaxID=1981512 RepID=A0A6L9S456_9ACTN|nr:BTAD domain-containing putative transcriptional regulator [Phytoactinopolyspora halotolerans]NED99915.1 AfsR/SARP family transcriptional regulator [Phytoactinopolyspora halotolerans]
MQIAMLGPLEVRADGDVAVQVGGLRLRTLLIALALEPGRVISTSRLVEAIWADEPPERAVNAVQALVSRLRRVLPDSVIQVHASGYRLAIEPDAVDVVRFERMTTAGRAAARAGEPETAAHLLREALDLWRGAALSDVAEKDYFRGPAARLAEMRLAAIEDRVEADLRLGRGAELTTELTTVVAEHPLRERLVASLMRSLCAAGRPAEALQAYESARQELADTLGTDPSAELSTLHTAILRGELGSGPARSAAAPGTPSSEAVPPSAWTVDRAPSSEASGPLTSGPQTNLRAGLTSFIGRDEDVVEVGRLVDRHRLVTLTGPGGAGKTRLSIESARTLTDRIPDGTWLVELASVRDGADVPQAILTALGLRDQAIAGWTSVDEPVGRLASALRLRRTLLVLDNCEHVIDAVASLVDRLLGQCPHLRILATSREPLSIAGESVWPVRPFSLPPEHATATEALSYPAVRLLADRGAAARPGFEVTEQTAAAVVRVCRALDGMPLAIELAAARLRTMTVEQLANRLDDRFRLLTSGSRVASRQHRTLRAVVDWSWELLSDEERVLLRRLALFTGGATIESAERVCAGDAVDADRVVELLVTLTDKSLLVSDDTDDAPRYRMLETIRTYCLERLDGAGERERIRRAHADYFIELAETVDPHLRRAEQLAWRDRLAAEHDNLTSALREAVAVGDAQRAVRLVAAAGWYWWVSGRKVEGLEMAEAALELPGEVADTARAGACAVAAVFSTAGIGDERTAQKWLDQVADLDLSAQDGSPLLRFLRPLGEMARAAADGAPAGEYIVDDLLTDTDPWVRAMARLNRARLQYNLGHDMVGATTDAEMALAEFRSIGERWGLSFALTTLADLVVLNGDLAAALAYYEEAIDVVIEMGMVEDVLFMRGKQILLRWLIGDVRGSAEAEAEADREARQITWPDGLAGLALAKAELARWKGDVATARKLLAETEAALRDFDVHAVFQAMILDLTAHLDAAEGEHETARARRSEALALAVQSTHAPTVGQVLVGIADQALRMESPSEAAAMLAAADAIRGAPDRFAPDAARIEGRARAALGDEGYAEAARRGHEVTLATVRDLAAPILDA